MRKTTFIVLIITILLACNNKQPQDAQQPPIPKALEEKGSYSIVTKRGYNNVVEDLYEELVKNTPDLKNLETQIEAVMDNRNDSSKNFNFYNDKNTGYYEQANQKTNEIKDSSLKEKVRALITASNSKYQNKIDSYSKLLESINAKTLTLEDLHTFLKIKTTMAVMEKYQADNLPSAKPIEANLKQIDNVVEKLDGFIKK
jgi:hypothetical protein